MSSSYQQDGRPSIEVMQGIRFTYVALASIVLLMGFTNIARYLIIQQRWKAFPLTLTYTFGQLTLIFIIARLTCPD